MPRLSEFLQLLENQTIPVTAYLHYTPLNPLHSNYTPMNVTLYLHTDGGAGRLINDELASFTNDTEVVGVNIN